MILKYRDIYLKIVSLIDGSHQMHVFQRVLFKRYNCLILQDSFVDSGTTAAESVCQAFEGRHYYRSLSLHKEGFDALFQRSVEDTSIKFKLIHLDLLNNLSELRQRPSSKALEQVTNMKEQKELATAVLSITKTRS